MQTHTPYVCSHRLLSAYHSTHEMLVLHTGEWFHIIEQYLTGHMYLVHQQLIVPTASCEKTWFGSMMIFELVNVGRMLRRGSLSL